MEVREATATAPPRRTSRFLRAFDASWIVLVPLALAVNAAGLVWSLSGIPSRGIPVAIGVFAAVLVLAHLVVRAVRRRPAWRRVARVLVAAHVVFWSARGWIATTIHAAGPVSPASVAAWDGPPRPFLAGVGEASFHLTREDTLAGYGGGERRVAYPWPALGPLARLSQDAMARGTKDGRPAVPMFRTGVLAADDLGAKALMIRPVPPVGPESPLVIVRLDLLVSDARLHAEVARRVADLLVAPESLLLCATHTHSGPCGFACARLAQLFGTDHLRRDVLDRVATAAEKAVREAYGSAEPARIGFVTARDVGLDGRPILAHNRRYTPQDPDRADTEVLGIRLDAASGSRRIALLLNYAVHPVWGRREDVEFSKDLAGALERSSAIGAGAPVLFVNGAEGDIRPRIKSPRADRPTTLAPFEDAVAPGLAARATEGRLRVVCATVKRDMGSGWYPHPILGSRQALIGSAERPWSNGFGDAAANALLLPANVLLWSAALEDLRLAGSFRGGFGAVAVLDSYLDHRTFAFGAIRLETPSGTAAICWTPAELLTSVGEQVKAAARARGAAPVYVFGLVNDAMAYAGTPSEYAEGGYEGRNTLFGPETSPRILESLSAALSAAGF